jgi:hypothetical protein
MPAIGMMMTWFGYSLSSWGYCLVRGYNVKFTDWLNPIHPYSGPWPPPADIPGGSVLPGQASSGAATTTTSTKTKTRGGGGMTNA